MARTFAGLSVIPQLGLSKILTRNLGHGSVCNSCTNKTTKYFTVA